MEVQAISFLLIAGYNNLDTEVHLMQSNPAWERKLVHWKHTIEKINNMQAAKRATNPSAAANVVKTTTQSVRGVEYRATSLPSARIR